MFKSGGGGGGGWGPIGQIESAEDCHSSIQKSRALSPSSQMKFF